MGNIKLNLDNYNLTDIEKELLIILTNYKLADDIRIIKINSKDATLEVEIDITVGNERFLSKITFDNEKIIFNSDKINFTFDEELINDAFFGININYLGYNFDCRILVDSRYMKFENSERIVGYYEFDSQIEEDYNNDKLSGHSIQLAMLVIFGLSKLLEDKSKQIIFIAEALQSEKLYSNLYRYYKDGEHDCDPLLLKDDYAEIPIRRENGNGNYELYTFKKDGSIYYEAQLSKDKKQCFEPIFDVRKSDEKEIIGYKYQFIENGINYTYRITCYDSTIEAYKVDNHEPIVLMHTIGIENKEFDRSNFICHCIGKLNYEKNEFRCKYEIDIHRTELQVISKRIERLKDYLKQKYADKYAERDTRIFEDNALRIIALSIGSLKDEDEKASESERLLAAEYIYNYYISDYYDTYTMNLIMTKISATKNIYGLKLLTAENINNDRLQNFLWRIEDEYNENKSRALENIFTTNPGLFENVHCYYRVFELINKCNSCEDISLVCQYIYSAFNNNKILSLRLIVLDLMFSNPDLYKEVFNKYGITKLSIELAQLLNNMEESKRIDFIKEISNEQLTESAVEKVRRS